MGIVANGVEYSRFGDGWQRRRADSDEEWKSVPAQSVPDDVLVQEMTSAIRRATLDGDRQAVEDTINQAPLRIRSRVGAAVADVAETTRPGLGVKIIRGGGKQEP